MPWRRYIREILVLTELAIIFLIIAFLLASTIPGLLRVRKRSQTSKMVTLSRSSNRLATV